MRIIQLTSILTFMVLFFGTLAVGSDQVADVSNTVSRLPELESASVRAQTGDFLIDQPTDFQVRALKNRDGHSFILDNRLIPKTWRLSGDYSQIGSVGFEPDLLHPAKLVVIHVAEKPTRRLKWKQRRRFPASDSQWPPKGRQATMWVIR